MAQCTECGARNAEQATFCVRCGAELRTEVARQVGPGQDTDRIDPVEGEIVSDDVPGYTVVMEPSEAPVAAPVPEAERLLRDASARLGRGDADGAAMDCREAVALAPDLVAGYSLLGMAEEQRGNTVAAAGAYRRVLQLDPGRNVEREKLEALYESGGASRPEGEEFGGAEDNPALRFAPWIAAAAAAFFVLMILTAVGLRVHSARQAERAYDQQMAVAERAMKSGDYGAAVSAYGAALRARPGDEEAEKLLRWARRRSATAQSPAGYADIPQPMPSLATVMPSGGPNPFLPVPIGTRTPPADALDQPQTQAQQSGTRATPPPVVSTERVVGGQQAPQAPAQTPGPVPFGPLDVPDDGGGQPAAADQGEEPAEPAPEPQRRGEISIWVSDAPARGSRQPTAAAPARSAAAAQATELRRQADQARTGGNCERAAELYGAAIEAYRADTTGNPGNRQVNEAAIEACRRARSLCEAAEGQ